MSDKKEEALKLAREWIGESPERRTVSAGKMVAILSEALAEQQETVDKSGSPCPKFWDWLPKAYDFEGLGNFTKYNMEVAFLAGKQSVPTQRTWAGLTDEDISKMPSWIYSPDQDGMTAEEGLEVFARSIEAKLREKNA